MSTRAGRLASAMALGAVLAPAAQSNIDHAKAKSRGGNNTQANAQNTCRECNQRKGTKSTEEFLGK